MERRIMSHKKPMILVFAGPNGSGKSTITGYFEKVGIYTNADDIVAATGMDNEEAARQLKNKKLLEIIDRIVYDGTQKMKYGIQRHKMSPCYCQTAGLAFFLFYRKFL